MTKTFYKIAAFAFSAAMFVSCDNSQEMKPSNEISQSVLAKIADAGFDPNNVIRSSEGGYIVENDIYLTDESLDGIIASNYLPTLEQYRTTNLVNVSGGTRTFKIYAPTSGTGAYSSAMIAGLDEAIRRYNAEPLLIKFTRITTSTGANITMTRLSSTDENAGVLGSAGFPSGGNPYNNIKMSGVLQSKYGFTTNAIATVIAHEMGHCIGFRHTDYYNRAISCGGSVSNEGSSGVGAIHIPGTPTTATAAANSWMLACTNGGNRPFNTDDKVALNYLY